MSERKQGFYWVRWQSGWSVAEWVGEGMDWWVSPGMEGRVPESCFEEIGHRIPSPDEMEGWQIVPVEPNFGMIRAAGSRASYKNALAAAPRFGVEP